MPSENGENGFQKDEFLALIDHMLPTMAKQLMQGIVYHAANVIYKLLEDIPEDVVAKAERKLKYPEHPNDKTAGFGMILGEVLSPAMGLLELIRKPDSEEPVKQLFALIREHGLDNNDLGGIFTSDYSNSFMHETFNIFDQLTSVTSGKLFSDIAPKTISLLGLKENTSIESILTPNNLKTLVAFLVLWKIISLKILEEQLIASNPKLDYFEMTSKLDDSLESIVSLHTVLQVCEPGNELVKTTTENFLDRSKGAKEAKAKKEPIFSGFITWATNLPQNHNYLSAAHGARAYKDELRDKDSKIYNPDLLKMGGTIDTMTRRLAKHCEKNNIKNPLKKQKPS